MKQWVGRRILQKESPEVGWAMHNPFLLIICFWDKRYHFSKPKKEKNKNEQKKTENPPHHVRGAAKQRAIEHGGLWLTHLLPMLPHQRTSDWFLGWSFYLCLWRQRTLLLVSRLLYWMKTKGVAKRDHCSDLCYVLYHLPRSSMEWVTLELRCVIMLGPRMVDNGAVTGETPRNSVLSANAIKN